VYVVQLQKERQEKLNSIKARRDARALVEREELTWGINSGSTSVLIDEYEEAPGQLNDIAFIDPNGQNVLTKSR
jgi:hypothetical protein